MLGLVRQVTNTGSTYVEFMLHSSELMPGGSHTFSTSESIEALYADVEKVFKAAASSFSGMTLTEYARSMTS
jgi:hypothetical protein